jgi:hypothetical protein
MQLKYLHRDALCTKSLVIAPDNSMISFHFTDIIFSR